VCPVTQGQEHATPFLHNSAHPRSDCVMESESDATARATGGRAEAVRTMVAPHNRVRVCFAMRDSSPMRLEEVVAGGGGPTAGHRLSHGGWSEGRSDHGGVVTRGALGWSFVVAHELDLLPLVWPPST
jgi:hypothetical protein